MITATILECNHLACFAALVTIKHLKPRRERKKISMSGGCIDIGVSLQKQVHTTQISNSQNQNRNKTYKNVQSHH